MIGISFRIIWRILILLLGVGLAFGVIDKALPYLHRFMPIGLVFFIIYISAAYIGIPVLIRLWRMVIKPDHLPVYVTTGDGWASDPINIAIVCKSQSHLIKSMKNAGWTMSDKSSLVNFIKTGYAILFNKPYQKATMSRLYLFNRHQDLAFQLQAGDSPSPRNRHHVRFWRLETSKENHEHNDFWHNLMKLFKHHRSEIWIGTATHDVGFIAFRMRNFQLTHQIDSDTNKERDYLINTLEKANLLRDKPEIITTGHKLSFRGQSFGVNIIVDGRLKVVRLKK